MYREEGRTMPMTVHIGAATVRERSPGRASGRLARPRCRGRAGPARSGPAGPVLHPARLPASRHPPRTLTQSATTYPYKWNKNPEPCARSAEMFTNRVRELHRMDSNPPFPHTRTPRLGPETGIFAPEIGLLQPPLST